MLTMRHALLPILATLVATSLWPVAARAEREPYKERRIGAKLRGQGPWMSGRQSPSFDWVSVGGAALAITMFDWAEVDGGATAIESDDRSGVHGFVQFGLTPPLYDGRGARGPGLVLSGVAYMGYHYMDLRESDSDGARVVDTLQSLGFDAGAELTYWFDLRFGLSLRALFDVAIPVSAEQATTVGAAQPTFVDLPRDPLIGWTGTLGLAF